MAQTAPFDLDKFLGGASPVRLEPRSEAGAVHANGMVDIARLIAFAPSRDKAKRSILVAR